MIYMIRGWNEEQDLSTVNLVEGPKGQDLDELYREFCQTDIEPIEGRAVQFVHWLKRSKKWRIIKPPVFHIRDEDLEHTEDYEDIEDDAGL